MYELRNGLTHQYLASIDIAHIRYIQLVNDWDTKQAIFWDINEFTLNVAQLVQDLGMAWAKLRITLEADKSKRERIASLLDSLPILE